MAQYLSLTPRDPIIARDGRPFGVGQGYRMKSVDWPYPSVLAGSLRTLLSDLAGGEFTPERIVALKQVGVAGPLPAVNGELYFPAPKDLIVWESEQKKGGEKEREIMSLRPMQLSPGERICDLPDGLSPVTVTEDFK